MSWIAVGISVATAVIGAGVTIYGQEQQKKAVEAQADYNEEVAKNEATRINEETRQNAMRVSKEKNRAISAIRAANAANGLALEGTPLAVLGDVATEFEQEIADLGYAAANRRAALLSEATLGQWSADTQKTAIGISQVATGISGIGTAATGYGRSTGKISSGKIN